MSGSVESQRDEAVPRILVVDDAEDSLAGLTRLLRMGGYAVEAASCGEEALALLRRGEPFDIVLTDLMLPDIDGKKVAEAVRSLPKRPILALATGHSQFDADDPGCRGMFDLVFLKPLVVKDMLATFNAALLARAAEQAGEK